MLFRSHFHAAPGLGSHHGPADGGGHQVVLHPHVQHAGDAAGRVVGVQRAEHQVARERGLDGDARGFQVAHFADHDDVRVLADDRTQRVREVEADLRLRLDLVDAFDLVFDRVLDRDDLDVRLVQLGQRGVQRGGLARAGGAGDQQDAVRAVDEIGRASCRERVY